MVLETPEGEMFVDVVLIQVTALVSDQPKITGNCPNYSKVKRKYKNVLAKT